MSVLSKFKVKKDLKKQIEREDNKNDPRLLPYFNLKDGDKMEVLIVPDVNGNIWKQFSAHGPNLGVRTAGRIRCAHESTGDECPACQKGFGLLDLFRETEDETYKEEAKRWFSKDYVLCSVIVLDTPIDIPVSDDGNEVKLWYMPFKVVEHIKQQIKEGQIEPEDLTSTPFVIKATKNKGGRASYEHSYFSRQPVDDDVLAALEDSVIEPYDYENLDLVDPATTGNEVEEWLVSAEEKVAAADEAKARGGSSKKPETSRGVRSRLKDKQEKADQPDVEEEDNDQLDEDGPSAEGEHQPEEKETTKSESKGTSSLQERLAAARARRS